MDDKGTKRKHNWIIAQNWSQVLFFSFRYDAKLIEQKIPAELDVDTYDGSAWLSIVPFYMSRIRFRFTPVLPMCSLWELNLRTYVKYNGRPGIYFFTLDTDSWPGQKIARYCFHLPYRLRKINAQTSNGHYSFESPNSFKVEAKQGSMVESDPLDVWLTERYHLYTKTTNHLYRGDVMHEPWQLEEVDVISFEDTFSPQFGFDPAANIRARYAESLDVRFRPFVKLI